MKKEGFMTQISGKVEKPKINVFLSYKREDYDVAKVIKDSLEVLSVGKIQFHISEEIPVGEDWYEWIEKKLGIANWFMLLFTDPSNKWDWCLYEAGLFRGINGKKGGEITKVICLHDKCVKEPEQLVNFKNICAEEKAVEKFLEEILLEPLDKEMEPINPSFKDNLFLKEAVNKICKAIKGKVPPPKPEIKHSCFQKYLILHYSLINKDIEDAKILYSESNFNDIFSIDNMPKAWGDFKDLIKEIVDEEENKRGQNMDFGWIKEIEESIDKARKGIGFEQPKKIIKGVRDQKLYRPILAQMTSANQVDGLYCGDFHLMFVDHYGPEGSS